ncbi:uncharacterized protein TNCV_3804501 [Trichonephila clavipes]|nr:uncharacterized protein TNCV_3804501 [Trichonephila clavipes]
MKTRRKSLYLAQQQSEKQAEKPLSACVVIRLMPSSNPMQEVFGKRNMPGKRARRHFSQLSEFERGLIIGMKTAGWSMRRVAGLVDRSEFAVTNCWE